MSTLKVDTLATRTGSGNITLSNNVASLTSAGAISGTNLSASGTLAVTGNTTVGGTLVNTGLITASAGVAIGGTGSANTLDDYEEGTWTPTAGTGAGTLTSSTGVYTKIGRVVYVSAYVTFTGAATGSNRTYGGLPFPVLDYVGATSVDFQGLAWSNNSAGYLYFEGGSSNFQNNYQKTFQGSFTASDNSRFHGFYFTT